MLVKNEMALVGRIFQEKREMVSNKNDGPHMIITLSIQELRMENFSPAHLYSIGLSCKSSVRKLDNLQNIEFFSLKFARIKLPQTKSVLDSL